MEMHQLRYFKAVCETLNFTRAAELCHVAQPSLTRAIQKLEEELGGLLFRRERTRTHLTDFGQLLRGQLEQILRDAEAAKTTANSFLHLKDAPVKLGVMCTIGPTRFGGFLSELQRSYPGIHLTLHEGVPSRLSELLMEGEIDLAIMAQPEPFPERFDVRWLYDEHFGIAFPPGHRLESCNAARVCDLKGEAYLKRLNCEFYDYIAQIAEAQDSLARVAYQSEREDWILAMIMAGLGIACVPEFSVPPALPVRRLVDPPVVRQVCLVTVSGRRFSPAVASFFSSVRRYPWQSSSTS